MLNRSESPTSSFALMAERLYRNVPFHILPRDSPGHEEAFRKICSSPAPIESRAGNAQRRRRRRKTRTSSSMDSSLSVFNAGPQLAEASASSSISNPNGEILQSHQSSQGFSNGFEKCEDISSFSRGRVLTADNVKKPAVNESLASSTELKEDADVVLSQPGFLPACNSSSKSTSTEPENSHIFRVSGSTGFRSSDSTCGKGKQNDLLPSIKNQQENGVWESSRISAMALPQDGCSIYRNAFCKSGSTGEDLTSPKRNECPEQKKPGADILEEDISGSPSNHSLETSLLQNGTMSKAVSECTENNTRKKGAPEYYDTPKLPPHTPIVHVETPQLLDWDQLMAATSSCSQPADVSPLRYFLREVMRSSTPLDTQSAETRKKRQHVYNTMFHVPWRCELLIVVGFFVCLDSFLSLLTVVPLRTIIFLWGFFVNGRQFRRTHADELSDLGCLLVLVTGVTLLQQADISFIYHMIRSQATIKLYVVYNVLEIFDKLLQSFGSDVFQVVLNSAESVATCSSDQLLFDSFRFAMDECIALVSFIVHSLIILAEAITVSAAIRSHNSALLTLLISNNFAEIKSNVFKRLAKDNLQKLAYLDTVERFHIVAHLFFVFAQNLSAADEPWLLAFAYNASMVMLCEILVDAIKHAFLAKFNEIKPAAYSDFLQALCKQTLHSQSHDVHKTLAFVPLAPACVVIRVLIPLYTVYIPGEPTWRWSGIVLCIIVTYIFLVILKIGIGLGLLKHANWYVERCTKKEKYFHFD